MSFGLLVGLVVFATGYLIVATIIALLMDDADKAKEEEESDADSD